MKNTKKIYVVGNQHNYANFINDFVLVNDITTADIVIFTGGEDVDPSLYNCEKHPSTYSNINRDKVEMAEFNKVRSNQLCVGICRGGQFLCVMNGGKLIQDCTGHAMGCTHPIVDVKGSYVFEITSTHHQMQYPFCIPLDQWECLYMSSESRSRYYNGDGLEGGVPYEPEIVLYHRDNKPMCLAIQGHPEYMQKNSPIVIRLNEIINNLLKDLLKDED